MLPWLGIKIERKVYGNPSWAHTSSIPGQHFVYPGGHYTLASATKCATPMGECWFLLVFLRFATRGSFWRGVVANCLFSTSGTVFCPLHGIAMKFRGTIEAVCIILMRETGVLLNVWKAASLDVWICILKQILWPLVPVTVFDGECLHQRLAIQKSVHRWF